MFEDRVALVTGAGNGIGAATAKLLAKLGARVALVDRDTAALTSVREDIAASGGDAFELALDVSDADAVGQAVARVVDHWGRLDLAVNNAGVAGVSAVAGELDPADWAAINGVNYHGVFYCMRYEVPAMLAGGGGAIVNVSSNHWTRSLATRPGYAASKHGVVGLSRTAAIDYAARGIRVNVVAPGVVDTPLVAAHSAESEVIASHIPMRRLGRPSEIAGAIAFLLSQHASYITGAVLGVDGGILA